MFSTLTSLIWGAEEETSKDSKTDQLKPAQNDQIEIENEWIFIKEKECSDHKKQVNFNDDAASVASESADSINNGMEESWIVTPPQCFNNKRKKHTNIGPMENLLIEHPSMSIYQNEEDENNNSNGGVQTNVVATTRQETHHRAVAGRLMQLENRVPLKELNNKSERKKSSPNSLKRKNMVYVRSHSSRNNKQFGRMAGKHVGMVGKRGS